MRAVLQVIGEALIDLVDTGDRTTFRALPGGSPLNVAVTAARLGVPTALSARLADDAFGRLLRAARRAQRRRPRSRGRRRRADDSRRRLGRPDGGGASYDFYVEGTADWQWRVGELRLDERARIVHFGSLASWLPPGDEVVRAAAAAAGALVSYDPNVRPRLLGSAENGRRRVEAGVAVADVVKVSDEDLEFLYPDDDAAMVAARWFGRRRDARGGHRGGGRSHGLPPRARPAAPGRRTRRTSSTPSVPATRRWAACSLGCTTSARRRPLP